MLRFIINALNFLIFILIRFGGKQSIQGEDNCASSYIQVTMMALKINENSTYTWLVYKWRPKYRKRC